MTQSALSRGASAKVLLRRFPMTCAPQPQQRTRFLIFGRPARHTSLRSERRRGDVIASDFIIMASRCFGCPVTQRRELEEAVATFTDYAAAKMRPQGLASASLVVFVQTNRHKAELAQYYAARPVQLNVATADTSRLTTAAMHGRSCIWREEWRNSLTRKVASWFRRSPKPTRDKARFSSYPILPPASVTGRLWTLSTGVMAAAPLPTASPGKKSGGNCAQRTTMPGTRPVARAIAGIDRFATKPFGTGSAAAGYFTDKTTRIER